MSNPFGYSETWGIERHRDDLIGRLGEAIKRINTAEARIRELEQERDRLLKFCPFEEENVALQAQLQAVQKERDMALEAKTKLRDLHMSIIGDVREELAQLQAHNKAMRRTLNVLEKMTRSVVACAANGVLIKEIIDAALTLTQEKPK